MAMDRNPYVTDGLATASPARLLVMLYDRLVLDLDRAAIALDSDACETAHDCLVHAQDIINELRVALDFEVWPEGRNLAAIYDYAIELLITANINKDAVIVATVRSLVAPLRDAWHEAAGALAG